MRPHVLAPWQRDAVAAAAFAVHHPARDMLVDAALAGVEFMAAEIAFGPVNGRHMRHAEVFFQDDVLSFVPVGGAEPGAVPFGHETDAKTVSAPASAAAVVPGLIQHGRCRFPWATIWPAIPRPSVRVALTDRAAAWGSAGCRSRPFRSAARAAWQSTWWRLFRR